MIVFADGDFTLVNYKDKPGAYSTLFKICGITHQRVKTPALGKDFVIMYQADNKQDSGGSPYPGGVIYLQDGYAAVAYNKNKTYFDIVISPTYKPDKVYEQILPTRHRSTPMARLLKTNPDYFIFTHNGSISTFDDKAVAGTQADYVAFKEGQVCGYFGVKETIYFGCPYPQTGKAFDLKTLARHLHENSSAGCYQVGAAVPGLVWTNQIKTLVVDSRKKMANYQKLSVDYAVATAFMAPLSDAYEVNGVVTSGLSQGNAVNYIRDMRTQGKSVEGLVTAYVMTEENLLYHITRGFDKDGLVENLDKLDPSAVVLIDSDFQAILNLYNTAYNIAKEKISLAAIKRLQADLLALCGRINSFLPSRIDYMIGAAIKSKQGYANCDIKVSVPASISIPEAALPGLDLRPSADGANATLFTQTAMALVRGYGQDSHLTEEALESLKNGGDLESMGGVAFVNSYINQSDEDLLQSCIWRRVEKTILQPMMATFNNTGLGKHHDINLDFSLGKDYGAVRFMQFPNIFTGKYKHIPRRVFHPDAYLSFTPLQVNIKDAKIEVLADYEVIGAHDTVFRNTKMDKILKQKVYPELEKMLRTTGASAVNYESVDADDYLPNLIYNPYSENIWNTECIGKKRKCRIRLRVRFTYEFATDLVNLPIASHLGVEKGDEAEKAMMLASKYSQVVAYMAAGAAYETCKYLFQNLKDAYDYKPIGMIGTSSDGVVVNLADMGKFCPVDEAYISMLITLIESIEDKACRDKMQLFIDDMKNASATWKMYTPVYWTTYAKIMSALPVVDTNALAHYLFGAFKC